MTLLKFAILLAMIVAFPPILLPIGVYAFAKIPVTANKI